MKRLVIRIDNAKQPGELGSAVLSASTGHPNRDNGPRDRFDLVLRFKTKKQAANLIALIREQYSI